MLSAAMTKTQPRHAMPLRGPRAAMPPIVYHVVRRTIDCELAGAMSIFFDYAMIPQLTDIFDTLSMSASCRY